VGSEMFKRQVDDRETHVPVGRAADLDHPAPVRASVGDRVERLLYPGALHVDAAGDAAHSDDLALEHAHELAPDLTV
jgi:hypothetical protein